MKVLAICPSFSGIIKKELVHMYPLGFAVLAALTPEDVEFRFIDDRLEDIPWDDDPDLVALSAETYNVQRAYEIADRFRAKNVPVVIGGIHPALMPDEALEHADSIVIRDAENTWGQVLSDIRAGELKRIYQAPLGRGDLQHVAPDRSIFKDKPYFPSDIVEIGRGCPHNCEFCSVAATYKGRCRTKRIEKIEEDLASLNRRNLYLADDNFVARADRTIELCRAMAPFRKKWVAEGSVRVANNRALMKSMADAGCLSLLIGFESLNCETLRLMGKSWTNARRSYADAIALMRDHGISVYGSFVLGYDTDTGDDIKRTLEFAMEQKLALASFNQLVPFPGTPLYQRMKDEGRLLYDKWWLDPDYEMEKPLFRPARMTPDELVETCLSCRKTFYGFRSVLGRMADFRANMRTPSNAFFFLMSNLSSWKNTVVQDN